MAYNIGPKIGIDGEAEFRKQVEQINAAYKTMQAEVRAVTAEFDKNDDAQGKLKATSEILQKQITAQREKIMLLEEAVQNASKKYDSNSKEVQRLEGALYDAQATLSGLEKELAEADDGLERAEDGMSDFADQTDNASDAALNFGDVLKANLLSDAIMSGLSKLVDIAKDFASGMITAAAEVQAENAQFTQTFGEMEDAARSSLQAVADEAGITATRMQGSYTKIYAFAKTMGADSEQALDIASRAMRAAADSAAYYDRSIEDVTDTIQSFIKGSYENDAALGISATETTRNTEANKRYAKSFNELSEAQKVDTLLAMVEAGNAASGALGQAARESDSWENVTGELNEAQRQLQATLGKPVMQEIIPVIQKFSAAMSKAAKSGDLDSLAEGIGNTLGWIIDHGDTVVNMLGSIAAGFAAFKAAQKAGEIAQLAQQLITMGTASTTAGAAVAASGAVVGATPWGAIASLIGLVVGGVTMLATSIQDTETELEQATNAMAEGIDAAKEKFAESQVEIEGTAFAAEAYATRLRELEAAGLNTAAAQKEYELTVEALNELIPDLNLTIDEQTGLINKNIDALELEIDAWKRNAVAKALQDKYADVLKEQGEAQAKIVVAQAKQNKLIDEGETLQKRYNEEKSKLESISKKLTDAEEKFNAAAESGAGNVDELAETVLNLQDQYDACKETLMFDLEPAVKENEKAQKSLSKEIKDAQETVDSYAGDIQEAEDATRLYTEQTSKGKDETSNMTSKIQELQARLDEVSEAYQAAKASAQESLESQIGLFEDISTQCDLTMDDMIESLQAQTVAMNNYADNLQIAAERGIDQGLLKKLSDGSVESMQYLQVIVDGGEDAVEQLNAVFRDNLKATDYASEQMALMQDNLNEIFAGIAADAEEWGLHIVDGLVVGITDNANRFYRAIDRMASTGAGGFKQYFTINSPSGLMEEFGMYIDLGAAKGVEKWAYKFSDAMDELAAYGTRSFDTVAGRGYDLRTDQITRNVNLGGMTVQINVPNSVSNPQQIAQYVMDEVDRRAWRRVRAYYG